MSKLNWEQIWTKKALDHSEGDLTLAEIMRVNGYDVGYAKTDTDAMYEYVDGLIKHLELADGGHLLEVGCGAGAISMPMLERGHKLTGIDLSPDLIKIARQAMPGAEFHVSGAAEYTLEKRDFDAALSQGVFQFFPSQEYGAESVKNMLNHVRSGAVVGVTDLLDKALEETLMEERIRILGEEEYKKKYADTGLQHQFYDRATFEEAADGLCSECWFTDQFLNNPTAKYKFNFFARKA
ncbi:MAG: class I SAM-dependent methyltransferase [Pseudomonadota bacterium]